MSFVNYVVPAVDRFEVDGVGENVAKSAGLSLSACEMCRFVCVSVFFSIHGQVLPKE